MLEATLERGDGGSPRGRRAALTLDDGDAREAARARRLRRPRGDRSASGPRTSRTPRSPPTCRLTARCTARVELREALGSEVMVHFDDRCPSGGDRRDARAGRATPATSATLAQRRTSSGDRRRALRAALARARPGDADRGRASTRGRSTSSTPTRGSASTTQTRNERSDRHDAKRSRSTFAAGDRSARRSRPPQGAAATTTAAQLAEAAHVNRTSPATSRSTAIWSGDEEKLVPGR